MRITFSKLAFDLNPILLRPVLGLALVAAFAPACGGGSTPGTPGNAGTSGGTAGTTGSAGTTGTAGTSGSAGTTGAGGNSSGGNSVAGSSGGDAAGTTGSAGNGSTAGSGGGAQAGRGGSNAGAGGNATGGTGGGAQAGRGGSSAGAGGASAGAGGRGGTGGGGGGVTGTGGGGAATCPANATFCSGFETNALPTGAIYNVDAAPGEWTRDFAVDTAVKNSGASSLRVKWSSESGASGSAYRMLAVPATMNAFWVRFFIRSDMPIGMNPHNVFAGGSIGSGTNDATIEFAEDVGISFNTNDSVVWPTGYGRINGNMTPYSLTASTWHCIEISFDGNGRVQQLYVGGSQLINATSYPSGTTAWPLRFFKFGHRALHPEVVRVMWYDDVAVAPTRIGGCN